MNGINTVRDGDIIAAEINVIKENAKRVVISSAIEIGRRLVEAKSVVEHGGWMKWLEEKVYYSQSKANNLMKLYQEYGTGETNLFDNWTNSEAFGKLSYTQHLALLALPFEERAEFAENHPVADMSTRELEKEIRAELEKAKADAAASAEAAGKLREELNQANSRTREAEVEIAGHAKAADRHAKERERAEKSEKNALELAEKLKKELEAAKATENRMKAELEEARKNPEIPDSTMDAMRREIEAKAAEKAAARIREELAAAEQEAREAREKLAAMLEAEKRSDPDVVRFGVHLSSVQEEFGKMLEAVRRIAEADPEKGKKLKENVRAKLVKNMLDALEAL